MSASSDSGGFVSKYPKIQLFLLIILPMRMTMMEGNVGKTIPLATHLEMISIPPIKMVIYEREIVNMALFYPQYQPFSATLR